MTWQERWVDVERRSPAEAQDVGRHDLTVGDEHEPVGVEAGELTPRLVGAHASRGDDANAALAGRDGDGRGAELEPAAGRPVRLADHQQVIGGIYDTLEQRHAE